MELYLIRHGQTPANKKRRYIGITDEPLLASSVELLEQERAPEVDCLYVSPLLRCRQTAGILYPGKEQKIIDDLSECDFGHFENRSAEEMKDDPEYQAYVDSGATLAFPGGESPDQFRARFLSALEQILADMEANKKDRAAVVCHGGTIMTLLYERGCPKKDFYDWWTENGQIRHCRVDLSVRPALLNVVDDTDVPEEFPLG